MNRQVFVLLMIMGLVMFFDQVPLCADIDAEPGYSLIEQTSADLIAQNDSEFGVEEVDDEDDDGDEEDAPSGPLLVAHEADESSLPKCPWYTHLLKRFRA